MGQMTKSFASVNKEYTFRGNKLESDYTRIKNKSKVLVIDDEELICIAISDHLRIHGIESFSAASGSQAERILSESFF